MAMSDPLPFDPDAAIDEASELAERDPGMKGATMDQSCHRCGTVLVLNTGVNFDGKRMERAGVCPDCRLDSVGGVAFVDLIAPRDLSDRAENRLSRRQRAASAQSAQSVAAFVDGMLPAGTYVARRTSPMTVTLTWADGIELTDDHVEDLAARMRMTPSPTAWTVEVADGHDAIRVIDKQVSGASDD